MSVIVERNGPVTTLVIARPERRNAVDRPTAQALADALREFEADDTARVAVLTGSGGNFCAGADLAAVAEDGERRNRLEAEGDGPMGPSRMQARQAADRRHRRLCGGRRAGLALLADLRVMAEDAICGVFCRRFGVPLIDGGSVRLPRIVGQGRALDLILTGRPVKADEALQIGLANRVVPSGSARAEAEAAAELAAFPQTCMLADRASVYAQWELSFDVALANEFQGGLAVIERRDPGGRAALRTARGATGASSDAVAPPGLAVDDHVALAHGFLHPTPRLFSGSSRASPASMRMVSPPSGVKVQRPCRKWQNSCSTICRRQRPGCIPRCRFPPGRCAPRRRRGSARPARQAAPRPGWRRQDRRRRYFQKGQGHAVFLCGRWRDSQRIRLSMPAARVCARLRRQGALCGSARTRSSWTKLRMIAL